MKLKKNNNSLKPPIILIGNVRSGTTMIQRLFALHPEVTTWFEPRTIWNYADPGKKWDRLDETDAKPHVKKYIRKKFLQYQKKNGNLRIMEKTPSNIVRIPYVHNIFPESKLLYIIREPLAQISSSELKWQRVVDWSDRNWAFYRIKQTPNTQLVYYFKKFLVELYQKKILKKKHAHLFGIRYQGIYNDLKILTTEEINAKQWAYCSMQAEEDICKLDKDIVMRIKYEDFVADPVAKFEKILKFFNLNMPEGMSTSISKSVDPGRQQKWQSLDKKILNDCLPYLRDEIKRHGYNIPVI